MMMAAKMAMVSFSGDEDRPFAEYCGAGNSTANASSYTFNSFNAGTPSPTRRLVILAKTRASIGAGQINSMTVNGVAATELYAPENHHKFYISDIIPSGATANIVVLTGSQSCMGIDVYAVHNLQSPTALDVGTAGDNTDIPIAAMRGALIFASGYVSGNATVTMTGVSKDSDRQVESGSFSAFAGHAVALADGTVNANLDFSATGFGAAAAAVALR